jgi:hypothetical protein
MQYIVDLQVNHINVMQWFLKLFMKYSIYVDNVWAKVLEQIRYSRKVDEHRPSIIFV